MRDVTLDGADAAYSGKLIQQIIACTAVGLASDR